VVDIDPEPYVVVNPEFVRPGDPVSLVGDATKARTKLGWWPRTSFEEMIRLMVEHDLHELGAGRSRTPTDITP
jgi:GDPmannose 4,6-dehydratase